ncbi:hypothetical protein ACWF95_36715 [Streptomyces vinaceus]
MDLDHGLLAWVHGTAGAVAGCWKEAMRETPGIRQIRLAPQGCGLLEVKVKW